MDRLFVFGQIGQLGGAQTEVWDTLRMWRSHGLDVHVLSLVPINPQTRQALESIGCRGIDCQPDNLSEIEGLAGSVVVDICNATFLHTAAILRRLGCRIAWYNCMSFNYPSELRYYAKSGFLDAHLFNGEWQRRTLEEELLPLGYNTAIGHTIRSSFAIDDWEFAPRPANLSSDFVIGRLSRPDFTKWSKETWALYRQVRHPSRKALVMGIDERLSDWLGPTPNWATALPPCALSAQEFLRRLHCLIPLNHAVFEAWPRVGLEAMAIGVPIVARAEGGWCDLIRHGETGFLAHNNREVVSYANLLARDEQLRMSIVHQARRELESELASPNLAWQSWQPVFERLSSPWDPHAPKRAKHGGQ